MSIFANVSQGMLAQRDTNERKRSELSKAFQEFRSSNPHASLAEMQQYIDAQSGGRNYLSRGAPSGQVLRGIADQNAAAKTQADTNARLSQMQEQSRVMDMIGEAADRALRDANGDVMKAAEAVRRQMGGDFGSIKPEDIFNTERWERIKREDLQKNYEPAKTFILDSVDADGKITATPEMVHRNFGMPPEVAEHILTRVQADREKEAARLKADREKEMRQTRREALAFVIEEIEKDPERKPEEALEFFYGVPQSEMPPDLVEAVRKDSAAAKQKREDDRQRQIDTTISQGKRDLMTALNTDQDIRAALMAGDQQAAIQGMLAYAETFPPEVKDQLTGTWLDQQIARTLASMQQTQRLQTAQRRTELSAQSIEKGKEFRDAVGARVDGAIEAKTLTGPIQGMVAQTLANQYALDDSHIMAIEQLAQDNPDMGVTELHNLAKTTLENAGVPKLTDAATQVQETFMRTQGGVENPMTFDEWEQTVASDVTEDRTTVDKLFQDVMVLPDPSARAERLTALKASVVATHERFKAGVAADATNAVQMLTYGTSPWDDARAAKQVQDHARMAQAAIKKIEAAEASAARQAAAVGNHQANLSGGRPAPSPQRSPLGNAMAGAKAGLEGKTDLNSMGYDYRNSLFDRIMEPQEKFDADAYVTNFMRGARTQLLADPQAFAAFQADPLGFMRSSQLPWVQEGVKALGPVPAYQYP